MAYIMYTIEINPYRKIINCYNRDTSIDINGHYIDLSADSSAEIICHVYLYKKLLNKRTTRKHRIKLKKIVDRLADYKELEDLDG